MPPEWTDDDIPHFEEPEETGPRRLTPDEIRAAILGGRSYAPEDDVLRALRMRPGKGGPVALPSALNLQNILSLDTRMTDAIRLNTFSGRPWVRTPYADALAEADDTTPTEIQLWIEQVYGIQVSARAAVAAIAVEAKGSPFHPVRDRIAATQWDGEPRVDALLCRYFGVDDSVLTRAIARCFMVSCIARIRSPGCKVDTVLVLCGGQGQHKSTALRTLALDDEWFSDTPPDWRSKDFFQNIPGKWLYEIAEIDVALQGNSASLVKGLLSSQVDHYRSSYGFYATGKPRQTVFVGSTNEREFLRDRTGNRRFWPVTIGAIDHGALREDVAQLWAEADVMYLSGEPWYLSGDLATRQADDALAYTESDPWESSILEWLARQSAPWSIDAVYLEALSISDRTRWSTPTDHRIASILRAANCEAVRVRLPDGTRPRMWRRKP